MLQPPRLHLPLAPSNRLLVRRLLGGRGGGVEALVDGAVERAAEHFACALGFVSERVRLLDSPSSRIIPLTYPSGGNGIG